MNSSIIIDCSENKEIHERLRIAKEQYNSLGLAVIPLRRNKKHTAGKSACTRGWMQATALTDFDTKVCDNIGIVCGKASGICCIDVDQKDNGVFYFNKLIENYGMPVCPTQQTPNDGKHYIFRYNHELMKGMKPKIKGFTVNGKQVGVDMWIQKCQFVASPSINYDNGKMYKWIVPLPTNRNDIPELPKWIYDLYHTGRSTEDGYIINDKDEIEISPIDDDMKSNEQTPDIEKIKETIKQCQDKKNKKANKKNKKDKNNNSDDSIKPGTMTDEEYDKLVQTGSYTTSNTSIVPTATFTGIITNNSTMIANVFMTFSLIIFAILMFIVRITAYSSTNENRMVIKTNVKRFINFVIDILFGH